ncbi:MAG: LytR C-terminal domain-containing protein, partial [Candidatus Syntrophosphaera sp.]
MILILMVLVILALISARILAPGMETVRYDEKNLPAIKVVVRNGCGIENLAADYTNHIRDENIDVLHVGDMPHPIYNKSLIEAKS